jgi:hypothetical protein
MQAASTATTPAAMQEFMNSYLGKTFTVPGGGLTTDDLDRCREDYRFTDYQGQPCVMGVDVGLKFHVVIREETSRRSSRLNSGDAEAGGRLWFAGEVDGLDELHRLWDNYHVSRAVIDALPEVRVAGAFAVEHRGCRVAFFHDDAKRGHEPKKERGRPDSIHLYRTLALDEVTALFRTGDLAIPQDARDLVGGRDGKPGAYYRHLLAPTRSLEQDSLGNWRPKWTGSTEDHFAMAEVYAWAAAEVVRKPGFGIYVPPPVT